MEYMEDLISEFDHNYQQTFRPLHPTLTPLCTPAHCVVGEEDTVLRLHPSPTPALEEQVSSPKPSVKIRSPILPPGQEKNVKKRQSPKKNSSSLSTISKPKSNKENVKRTSDEDGSKSRKRAKESESSSVVKDKQRVDDSKFKKPLKPAQDKTLKPSERHNQEVKSGYDRGSTATNSSREQQADEAYPWIRHDDRRPPQAPNRRPSNWNFSGHLFDRAVPPIRRMCTLSNEEYRYLKTMPTSWHR